MEEKPFHHKKKKKKKKNLFFICPLSVRGKLSQDGDNRPHVDLKKPPNTNLPFPLLKSPICGNTFSLLKPRKIYKKEEYSIQCFFFFSFFLLPAIKRKAERKVTRTKGFFFLFLQIYSMDITFLSTSRMSPSLENYQNLRFKNQPISLQSQLRSLSTKNQGVTELQADSHRARQVASDPFSLTQESPIFSTPQRRRKNPYNSKCNSNFPEEVFSLPKPSSSPCFVPVIMLSAFFLGWVSPLEIKHIYTRSLPHRIFRHSLLEKACKICLSFHHHIWPLIPLYFLIMDIIWTIGEPLPCSESGNLTNSSQSWDKSLIICVSTQSGPFARLLLLGVCVAVHLRMWWVSSSITSRWDYLTQLPICIVGGRLAEKAVQNVRRTNTLHSLVNWVFAILACVWWSDSHFHSHILLSQLENRNFLHSSSVAFISTIICIFILATAHSLLSLDILSYKSTASTLAHLIFTGSLSSHAAASHHFALRRWASFSQTIWRSLCCLLVISDTLVLLFGVSSALPIAWTTFLRTKSPLQHSIQQSYDPTPDPITSIMLLGLLVIVSTARLFCSAQTKSWEFLYGQSSDLSIVAKKLLVSLNRSSRETESRQLNHNPWENDESEEDIYNIRMKEKYMAKMDFESFLLYLKICDIFANEPCNPSHKLDFTQNAALETIGQDNPIEFDSFLFQLSHKKLSME